jgi:hypothetical protein
MGAPPHGQGTRPEGDPYAVRFFSGFGESRDHPASRRGLPQEPAQGRGWTKRTPHRPNAATAPPGVKSLPQSAPSPFTGGLNRSRAKMGTKPNALSCDDRAGRLRWFWPARRGRSSGQGRGGAGGVSCWFAGFAGFVLEFWQKSYIAYAN